MKRATAAKILRVVCLSLVALASRAAVAPPPPGVGAGPEICVSPTGDDANPGTPAKPLRSLAKAAELARPGVAVVFEDGEYDLGVAIRPSGTAAAPIVFRARNPRKAVFHGAGPADAGRTPGIKIRGDYVVLDGLVIENYPNTGVTVDGTHATVRNCILHHNGWMVPKESFGGAGLLCGGNAHDLTLENNESWENREHGFYISGGADRPVIRGNRLHDNGDPNRALGGNGLQINADGGNWPTEKAIIEGNVISNNLANGIDLQGACGARIANNLIAANRKSGISAGKGSSENLIVNNTIQAVPKHLPAVHLGSGGNYGPSKDNRFRNNILVAEGGLPIVWDGTNAAPVEADYNLLWAGPGQPGAQEGRSRIRLTLADCRARGLETHSVVADPQFVDAARGDFHLRPGSPALAAGIAQPDVRADLDGIARPPGRAYDLGAFAVPKQER